MTRAAIGTVIWCAFALSLAAQQTQPQAPQTPPSDTSQPPATGRQGIPPGTVLTGPGRGRPAPPQPQQKQGVEYFVGTWDFEWTGRESPVSSGPRAGTTTFTRPGNGATLDIRTEGKSEEGAAFKESGSAQWNESEKTLTFKERLAMGAELAGVGSWASALSIRYESQPAKVGKQTVRVRRTYAILSAQSFTVAEELSIDGGPFQRLGNGAFSKKP